MIKAILAVGAIATTFFLFPRAPDLERDVARAATTTPAQTSSAARSDQGLLYGRVTTEDGDVYEGRLRFGGDEEALWGNTFNGARDGNAWAARLTEEQLPKERHSIGAFGIEVVGWDEPLDLDRPFMSRFGDIARIDADGRDLRVTLRSGTVVELDRYGADDFADGVRVWDAEHGVVDLDEGEVRTIELLPGDPPGAAPAPLYGTVRTREGEFTGFIQWDREEALALDELDGQTADGERSVRFEAIRSIERRSRESSLVRLANGRAIVFSGTRDAGEDNRGIYVDDPRFGRVLVSWDAFERVDFRRAGTAPAYDDFRPGRPLTGTVLTRSGHRLAGRLVYDLDESETTETLDAPAQGVDYMIPFGRIASIVVAGPEVGGPERVVVSLRSGEALELERAGDLGEGNGGLLVFVDGRARPEYVPWTDVAQVDFTAH